MRELFTIDIQSKTDVITNSSSEIFVLDQGNSKEELEALLDASDMLHWRSLYYPLCTTLELSDHAVIELAEDLITIDPWDFEEQSDYWNEWFNIKINQDAEDSWLDEEGFNGISEEGADKLREIISAENPTRLYLMGINENPGSYNYHVFESILGEENRHRLEAGWDYKLKTIKDE